MDQTIDSGQPFVLSCEADNIGTIQWFKDGLLLSNGAVMENSVVVNSALPSHAGVYECLASNAMGDDREEATVTVRCKSLISLSLHPFACYRYLMY